MSRSESEEDPVQLMTEHADMLALLGLNLLAALAEPSLIHVREFCSYGGRGTATTSAASCLLRSAVPVSSYSTGAAKDRVRLLCRELLTVRR